MRHKDLLSGVLTEVCESSTGMGAHARDWVIKGLDEGGNDLLVEPILELIWHVIGKLTEAVKRSVPDLWIFVLQMVKHDR